MPEDERESHNPPNAFNMSRQRFDRTNPDQRESQFNTLARAALATETLTDGNMIKSS